MGYGAMRITGPGIWGPPADKQAALAMLRKAIDLGVNLIDTADSYGPATSEELIAEALYPYPADLVIATKGGWERPGPNSVRNKYRIVRKLGQGGMGVVYLAEHLMLGGQIALKFLAAEFGRNPQFVKRFRNEARAAYPLRHPNIAEVIDPRPGGGRHPLHRHGVRGRTQPPRGAA
jgi:hypothetical protein